VGKRCAKLRSTAATSAAHGNVSVHCRTGWVSDELGHGDVEPLSGQPMLEVRSRPHGQLLYPKVGKDETLDTTCNPLEGSEKISSHYIIDNTTNDVDNNLL